MHHVWLLPIEKMNQINTKRLLEIEKEIVRKVAQGDNHCLRKSADWKAQTSMAFIPLTELICPSLDLLDFFSISVSL